MPTKTDLTIVSTSTENKTVNNKISYVNPNISDNDAIALAQKINNLTTNSYVSTTKTTAETLEEKVDRVLSGVRFTFGNQTFNQETPTAESFTINIPNSLIESATNKQLEAWFKSVSLTSMVNAVPYSTGDLTYLRSSYRSRNDTTGGWGNTCTIVTSLTSSEITSYNVVYVIPGDNVYAEKKIPVTINVVSGE